MSDKDQFIVPPLVEKAVIPRISRDEMNLAEFPLTVLSTRSNPKIKTLEFCDTVKNKSGEITNRKWIITAADKFGLPTASDDEVLLGLLKLTVDDGVKSPKVYFTRYEMLKTLRWTTEGRSYSRLQKALDRLSGVRIKASNAFFDNETKTHSTKNFGILDAYEINDGRDNDSKKSFFIWSEVIFKSFQVGFIKKLDLDFYLQLQSAVSKRIYRYLDKHFWYKARIQMNLITFAHEKIGISRNYKYVSSIRQQIDPAIEELIHCGFISSCEYTGKGSGAEIIIYSGKSMPRVLEKKTQNKTEEKTIRTFISDNIGSQNFSKQQTRINNDLINTTVQTVQVNKNSQPNENSDFQLIFNALAERGINPKQVEKILAGKDKEAFRRIEKIISHYDFLVSNGSPHISKNPVGFLYRAVENPFNFNLPGETLSRNSSYKKHTHQQTALPFNKPASTDFKDNYESLQSKYLIERKKRILELRETVETEMLEKIYLEVEKALSKLKGLISEPRFKEALDHGVDERLARLFVVPDFEEWIKVRRVVH